MYAKQLAVHKFDMLQTRIAHFYQTCIAAIEGAVDKGKSGKIHAIEIAGNEHALLVGAADKRVIPEVVFFICTVFDE